MNILTLLLATTVNFTVQTACHPDDVKTYDTTKLRERFVMEKVMVPDEIRVTYTMYDRLIYGGVMPVTKELTLDTFVELKATTSSTAASSASSMSGARASSRWTARRTTSSSRRRSMSAWARRW